VRKTGLPLSVLLANASAFPTVISDEDAVLGELIKPDRTASLVSNRPAELSLPLDVRESI
jgi:hypothetical protein